MKILFTADWHLCLRRKSVPVDWETDRLRLMYQKIGEISNEVDLHIIGGDLFDRTPNLAELQLFFEFVATASVKTLIYTGNHEAEKRNSSFMRFLKEPVKRLNPLVDIVLETTDFGDFYVVPYEEIKKENTWKALEEKPVFTHVRGAIPPHVTPEIPLDWLEKFPVVYAGDLHSYQNCQDNIRYPGSCYTTSFHRSETKNTNGYFIIDSDNWTDEWHDFELPQLIRKTVSSKEEMVPTEYHHTIYEWEGSIDQLSEKVDSELLDKKIVKRNSDVELILTEKMSMEDELLEYLTYILQIPNTEEVITAYHEYGTTE